MSTIRKKIGVILLSCLFTFFLWLGVIWYLTLHGSFNLQGSHSSIKVFPGADIIQVADELHQRGLLPHPRLLILTARFTQYANKLRYGEYLITPKMSAVNLLDNMISGQGLVQHHIIFIEGWTFKQMKEALNQNVNLRHSIANKSDAQIMQLLGDSRHPEGLFFPDTYSFVWGNSDVDVLKRSYKKMQSLLKEQWNKRAPDLSYKNPYEGLIVASLIEKEALKENERPLMAGVILKRLKKGMRLQVDPTVLYGLDKPYNAPITKSDLKTKTLYNTYKIKGLPPTPIGMPSAASIEAAFHPIDQGYLYYVLRGDGEGEHQFSKTYIEHLKAVKNYLAERFKATSLHDGVGQ